MLLNDTLLRELGCVNPMKLQSKSTATSVQTLARKLQRGFDTSAVVGGWKLLQVDCDIPSENHASRVEDLWNCVFWLQDFNGSEGYSMLSIDIKFFTCKGAVER